MIRGAYRSPRIRVALFWALATTAFAQTLPDYTVGTRPFPRIWQPYMAPRIAEPELTNPNTQALTVEDGKLRLSMAQLVALVVENNLAVASARYFPSIAQTDLLRARSGASPRGVD